MEKKVMQQEILRQSRLIEKLTDKNDKLKAD